MSEDTPSGTGGNTELVAAVRQLGWSANRLVEEDDALRRWMPRGRSPKGPWTG